MAYTCARVWLFAFVRIVHISGVNSYGTQNFLFLPVFYHVLALHYSLNRV